MSNTGLIIDSVGQNYIVSGSNQPIAAPAVPVVGDTECTFNALVMHATTNQAIEVRFRAARAAAGGGILKSDKAVTLTNGTDTIALLPSVPREWNAGGAACPFTVDTGISDATMLKVTVPAGGGTSADDATIYFHLNQAPA
jgi:hypothetical protein